MNALPDTSIDSGVPQPASFRARLHGFLKKAVSAPEGMRDSERVVASVRMPRVEAQVEAKPAAKSWMADGYLDRFSDQDKLVIRRIHQQQVRLSVFDDMTEEEEAISASANKTLKDALDRAEAASLLSVEQRIELFAELRENLTSVLESLDHHVQAKFAGTPHLQH